MQVPSNLGFWETVFLLLLVLGSLLFFVFAALSIVVSIAGFGYWVVKRTPPKSRIVRVLMPVGVVCLVGLSVWWGGAGFPRAPSWFPWG